LTWLDPAIHVFAPQLSRRDRPICVAGDDQSNPPSASDQAALRRFSAS